MLGGGRGAQPDARKAFKVQGVRSEAELYAVSYSDYTDEELRRDRSGIAVQVLEERVRGIRDLYASEVRAFLSSEVVNVEADNINASDYQDASLLITLGNGSQVRITGYEGLHVELIERPDAPVE